MAMALVQLISQASTLILSIVLNASLMEDYNTYTSAFSVANVLFLLADLGLGLKLVVDVAPNKSIAPQKLNTILLLRGMMGGLAILMTLALVLLQQMPSKVALAYMVIALSTAFSWIAQTFSAMFTAYERMYYVLMTSLVERAFTVTLAIVLVLMGFGLETVVLVVLSGSMLYVVLSYVVCSRFIVRPSRGVDLKQAMRELKEAAPFAINVGLVSTFYALNGFLLLSIIWGMNGREAGELANTLFYIAFNLVAALINVPTVFKQALLPVIARLYSSSPEMTGLAQQKLMKYMYSMGLPLTLGGMILADDIIGLLYADRTGSIIVLQVLLPVLAISYFGTGQGSLLAAAKLMHLSTISSSVGAALNFAVCIMTIPFLGPVGAALAFTLATLITNAIQYYFVYTRVVKLRIITIIGRPTLAGIGMAAVLLLLPDLNLFLAVGLGFLVYVALLFVFKAIDDEDKDIMKRVFKKD